MKRISMVFGLLIAAFFISGCASNDGYYKAVLAAQVAQADADNAKWRAVEAGMAKASPEAAGMAAMAIALGGKGSDAQRVQIAPPRDGWDIFLQGLTAFSTLTNVVGNAITPIRLAQEARKGNEVMYAANVAIEQARGASATAINGQTVSALSATAIAAATAPRGAVTTTMISNSLSGTGVLGNGTYTGPVTTTTSTTGSYNPVTTNPAPRVCTTSATGVLNCQGG